jgi:hypothetical protein
MSTLQMPSITLCVDNPYYRNAKSAIKYWRFKAIGSKNVSSSGNYYQECMQVLFWLLFLTGAP